MSATIIYNKLKSFGAFQGLSLEQSEQLTRQFTLLKSGANSKYHNMIIEFQGTRYHSLSEAYYHYLLQTQKSIVDIKTQVKYKLENMTGKKTMSYIADFVITTNDGREIVLDVKGRLTNENKIKLAYFRYVYKIDVLLVPTSGPDKFDLSFL